MAQHISAPKSTSDLRCGAHWIIESRNGEGHCEYYSSGDCGLLHVRCPYSGRHERKYPPRQDKTGLYTYANNEKVKRINARQKKLSQEE